MVDTVHDLLMFLFVGWLFMPDFVEGIVLRMQVGLLRSVDSDMCLLDEFVDWVSGFGWLVGWLTVVKPQR